MPPCAQILASDAHSTFQRLTAQVDGASDAFMAQLRWAIARDLPTLAAHRVTFEENTSPFPEEFIAHRIGLMAFAPTDPTLTSGTARLDADVPGRVRASHLAGDFAPVHPNLAVASLPDGCALRLRVHFHLGLGKRHQRYNHVAACRVAVHTCGMPHDKVECWCVDTAPGAVCADCAGTKAPAPGPTYHVLEFDTFGPIDASETLRRGLLATRAKLAHLRTQLRSSECAGAGAGLSPADPGCRGA